MTRRPYGSGTIRVRNGRLSLQYRARGRTLEEATGLEDTPKNRGKAERMLRKRLEAVEAGTLTPDQRRTRFEQLVEQIEAHYKANRLRSAQRLGTSLGHLRAYFGGQLAAAITTDQVALYRAHRLDEGAAAASINRELSHLRRMFRLGLEAGLVSRAPKVHMLKEAAPRRGFFEKEQLEAVVQHLPAELVPLARVAYVTGWRVRSELLTRQWQHVDLNAGWLRLDPGETKSGRGRQFPLTAELRQILKEQRKATSALEHAQGRIIPWVFHRNGKRIQSLYGAWREATRKAGVPGRYLHDFRRTAVRNLERAGVPRSAAMAMVGHETEAIYRRYAIAEESMLREAAKKLEGLK